MKKILDDAADKDSNVKAAQVEDQEATEKYDVALQQARQDGVADLAPNSKRSGLTAYRESRRRKDTSRRLTISIA